MDISWLGKILSCVLKNILSHQQNMLKNVSSNVHGMSLKYSSLSRSWTHEIKILFFCLEKFSNLKNLTVVCTSDYKWDPLGQTK